MKLGAKVNVFQDGKRARKGSGVVTATRNGHHIKVRFTYEAMTTETWFRKSKVRHGKWPRRHQQYEGWTNIDCFCPWFSVLKEKK